MMWWYEFLEKVTGNAFISHHTLNAFSYSLCSLYTHLCVHKLSDIVSSYRCVHFFKKKFLYFLYSLVNRFHSTCNTYGDRDILCFFKIIFIFFSSKRMRFHVFENKKNCYPPNMCTHWIWHTRQTIENNTLTCDVEKKQIIGFMWGDICYMTDYAVGYRRMTV